MRLLTELLRAHALAGNAVRAEEVSDSFLFSESSIISKVLALLTVNYEIDSLHFWKGSNLI